MTEEAKTYTAKDIEIERGYAQGFKAEAAELKQRYAGIDVEEIARIKAENQTLKTKQSGGDPKEIEKLINDAVEAERKRLEPTINESKSKVSELESKLKKELVTKSVITKAAELFNADGLTLLETVIEKDCELGENGIVIKGPDGKARFSKKDPTKYMDQSEYLETLAEQYPSLAKPSITGTGKSDATKINGSVSGTKTLSEINAMPDKGKAYMNELAQTNPKAYQALFSA